MEKSLSSTFLDLFHQQMIQDVPDSSYEMGLYD